jgi:sugar lactone lactonase YvrE
MEPVVEDVRASNGMDWSPDGETFYLVDTAALSIEAFDYTRGGGMLLNRRPFLTIERGAGAPDGMAVDDEGFLWVALPYAGQVRRYSAAAELAEIVETPTRMPTSCAFGGPDGRHLFITSQAGALMPADRDNGLGIERERIEAAHDDELAGALFVCEPGVSGPAARPFVT